MRPPLSLSSHASCVLVLGFGFCLLVLYIGEAVWPMGAGVFCEHDLALVVVLEFDVHLLVQSSGMAACRRGRRLVLQS